MYKYIILFCFNILHITIAIACIQMYGSAFGTCSSVLFFLTRLKLKKLFYWTFAKQIPKVIIIIWMPWLGRSYIVSLNNNIFNICSLFALVPLKTNALTFLFVFHFILCSGLQWSTFLCVLTIGRRWLHIAFVINNITWWRLMTQTTAQTSFFSWGMKRSTALVNVCYMLSPMWVIIWTFHWICN